MSIELIIITAVSAFNFICSIILLTMYKNAITELDELKKVKTKVEEINSVVELNDTAFEPIESFSKISRSPFKFSMIGLKPGDKIYYHGYEAIVNSNDNILFENEITSLSTAAMKIWQREHDGKRGTQMQGPAYWKYNGETLDNIRKRMENN